MAYYALKKDVFDKSKITVVGSPTITSDGVLIVNGSNSRYNYCKFDVNLFSATAPFKIEIPIKVTKLPNADALYFYVGSAIEVVITSSGELKVRLRSGTSDTYWDIALNQPIIPASVGLNQENLLGVIQYTGSEYRLGYKLNNIFTLVTTIQKNIKILEANFGHIGWNSTLEPEYTAFADLTKFKIYVDNQLVFQPVKPAYLLERRKEGYDSSKFTIVGSPTITEYGVASGFSNSNIIKSTKNIDLTTATSWSIKCRASVSSTTISTIFSIPQGAKAVRLFTRNGSFGFNIPISDSDWGTNANSNAVLNLNVDYYFKLELKNGYYTSYYSLDGIDFIQGATILKEHSVFQVNPIQIGGRNNTVDPFNGSINLPSISITVDGNEVFTGAKEVYYAMEK